MTGVTVVVPCFNEASRFQADAFGEFVRRNAEVRFIFVDDGSTDGTVDVLQALADAHPGNCRLMKLGKNVGKAEAVRQGLLAAFDSETTYAGFWDADLATPLDAIPLLCGVLSERPELQMVFGSRVRLLGRDIRRQVERHYLGRIFATAVSMMLHLPIYDSQCGAKIFRAQPLISGLFREPFVAKWVFDVEILARLIQALEPDGAARAGGLIYEFPLPVWHDIPGSKLRPGDFFRASLDLLRIRQRYLRDRGSAGRRTQVG
jgi:glycosyltransferase involved in cell wall biosynthesis